MRKTGIEAGDEKSNSFKIKSYSVEEILAAGGATAFANKIGKGSLNIADLLKDFPKEAFLTDQEAEVALEMLRNNK